MKGGEKIKSMPVYIFFVFLIFLSIMVSIASSSNIISYCVEHEDINEIIVTTKSKAKKEHRRLKNQGIHNEKSNY